MKITRRRSIMYTVVLSIILGISAVSAWAALPPDADLVDMSWSKESGLMVLSRYELFRSADGNSWSPAGLMDRAMPLSAVDGGKSLVLVGTESGSILRSVDSGPFVDVKQPKDPYGRAVAPIRMIAIHPKGTDALASSGQGLIRSKDKGATWEPVKDPFWSDPEARQVIAIGYAGGNPVIVTRHGTYRQTKKGFERVTKGLPESVKPTVAAMFNGQVLMALPGEGIYLAEKDSKWSKLGSAPGDPIAFVGFVAGGYLAARPTTALHWGDQKGKKWVPIGESYSPGFVPRESAATPFGDFVILRGKGLVHLEGTDFVPVPLPLSVSSVKARVKTVWESVIAGTRGGVYFSPDKGRSWKDVTPGDLGVAVNVFLTLSDGRILLGAEGAGVYSSPETGDTWTKYSRGLGTANTIRGLVEYDGGILAGTENGFMWIDGGAESTWASRDGGLGRTYIASLVREGNMYLAATQGGLFKATGSGDFKPVEGFKGSTTAVAASGDRILALVSGKVLLSEKGKKPSRLPDMPVRTVVVDVAFDGKALLAATTKGVFRFDDGAWKQAGSGSWPVDQFVRQDEGISYVTRGAGTFDLR